MYAIYGNIYHQNTPFMLAYIQAPWILWVIFGLPTETLNDVPKFGDSISGEIHPARRQRLAPALRLWGGTPDFDPLADSARLS